MKKQKKHTNGKFDYQKPFLSFTWVLVIFLLLFILCIGIIFDNGGIFSFLSAKSEKTSSEQSLPLSNPTPYVFNENQYQEAVIKDLQSKSIGSNDIPQIVSITSMKWPDVSLGCPMEGKMYAQVITPGYKMIVKVAGKEYTYHAGLNKVILCDR